jgi:exodeoxyribonuclease VII small subunit
MKRTEKKSYAESFQELQSIVDSLEGGDIDVDQMSEKVARAAELIATCQGRLRETELQVKKVIDGLKPEASEEIGRAHV